MAKGNRMASDPLLSPWTGPHGGLPRFDAIRIGNFKPALLKAMDLKRAEIAAIVGNTAAPTFENTDRKSVV